MEARIYIIDGITYTIIDHDVDLGLSLSDIENVLGNLHATNAYSSIISDLVSTGEASDSEIEINICIYQEIFIKKRRLNY